MSWTVGGRRTSREAQIENLQDVAGAKASTDSRWRDIKATQISTCQEVAGLPGTSAIC